MLRIRRGVSAMGAFSKIEWTDHTFNPWIGCTNVSPGCDHCYAEAQNTFRGWTEWGPHGARRRTSSANWKKPARWEADANSFLQERGRRQRVFCASLADWLDSKVPRAWRDELLDLIDATPNLDWLLLTKRPQNATKLVPIEWFGRPNVWLGITAEDAIRYRQRWPIVAQLPAVVRFVSYEPAIAPLGPVDLGIGVIPDWIISGGESGPRARTMQPAWARQVIADCRSLHIAPFHKQWGTYASNPLVYEQGMSKREAAAVDAHGKGGGLLDGEIVRQFPTPRPSAQAKLNAA
jgi:protein gp37